MAEAEFVHPDLIQAWVCEQPPVGVPYRVIRDEWVKDDTVRLIHEIELVTPKGDE